jgi:hypothetical protein
MGSYINKLFFQEALTVNVQMFYPDWTFLHFVTSATEVPLYIQSDHSGSLCPSCQHFSRQIHSHYWPILAQVNGYTYSFSVCFSSRPGTQILL